MTNMRRFRFSLASLISAVLFIAVACAALRNASKLWASMIFTLTVCLLLGAILGVVFRGGDTRAFCLGFALLGWGYLFLAFSHVINEDLNLRAPPLLTSMMLGYMHPKLAKSETIPGSGFRPEDFMDLGGPRTVFVPSWEHFHQVGHSLVTLLIALVGGGLARYLHASRRQPDDRPEGSQP